MDSMKLAWLAAKWNERKRLESEAVALRRAIEDQIAMAMEYTETQDRSISADLPEQGIRITLTPRHSRKVDGEKVQEIAAELGIEWPALQRLFRWRPELNVREWRLESQQITGPLSAAITTTAGRPSVSVDTISTEDTQ